MLAERVANLGSDQTKLYVTAKADLNDSTMRYLWIFSLPQNVRKNEITIDRGTNLFLISVPKTATTYFATPRKSVELAAAV